MSKTKYETNGKTSKVRKLQQKNCKPFTLRQFILCAQEYKCVCVLLHACVCVFVVTNTTKGSRKYSKMKYSVQQQEKII